MAPGSDAEAALQSTLQSLSTIAPTSPQLPQLLATAKHQLLTLNALLPGPETPPALLLAARRVLEAGALASIRAQDPDAFTRYYAQLQPFYEQPPSRFPSDDASASERAKVTGLYLLLLLTKGDYAGFHTVLEGLEGGATLGSGTDPPELLKNQSFIEYPIQLERWLMEGAYDRVWAATKRDGVPSEEFAVFSDVLTNTIRAEIASCSEKAYPSMPVANAKNLLFLDSEGAVLTFARERGWTARDGRIYFPTGDEDSPGPSGAGSAGALTRESGSRGPQSDALVISGQVIENTIGYARELETIV